MKYAIRVACISGRDGHFLIVAAIVVSLFEWS